MKTQIQKPIGTLVLLAFAILNLQFSTAHAQGTTAFTYQGQLRDGGTNANGTYTMIFKLYDAASGGNQIGSAITNSPMLANGLFTVNLDFGAGAFDGNARWLDITVTNGPDTQTLSPRVQVLPSPYAIFASVAETASNLNGTLPASQLTNSLLSAQLGGTYGNAVTFSNTANSFNGSFSGTFSGDGGGLTNLDASWLTSGTVPDAQLAGTYSNVVTFNNANNNFNGAFHGNGSAVTNLNASSLVNGTVPNLRLAGTYNNAVIFNNAANSFSGTFSGDFSGDGSSLLNLNASQLTFGVVPSAQLAGNYGSALAFDNPANSFSGDGSGLLNVDAAALDGLSSSNFATLGDLNNFVSFDDLVNSNYAGLDDDQDFTGANTFDQGVSFPGGWSVNSGSYQTYNNVLLFNQNGVTLFGIAPNAPTYGNLIELFGNCGVTGGLNVSGGLVAETYLNLDSANSTINFAGPTGTIHVYGASGTELDILTDVHAYNVYASGNMYATSFNTTSDRNLKEKFRPIDNREILERVVNLPVSEWNFKTDPKTRHIGPMAQDFYAAFKVGPDDKHIATVDEGGVALAAIQGLNQKLNEKDAEIQNLKKSIAKLEEQVSQLVGNKSK